MKANGSQIIVKLLEMEGIKTVAGIPGGSILPLYDELNKSSIKHILVRHEQAAGFLAQGITRSTGLPSVCMATSGPGAMNLLTAIADARCDSVPVIAITGQVNTTLIGSDAFQEADTFGLSFSITKHSIMIKDAKELFDVIPMAFDIALSGRPGPVLIDVPRNVQMQEIEFDEWPKIHSHEESRNSSYGARFNTASEKIPEILDEMAEVLCGSKKIALYLGGGCNTVKAEQAIREMMGAVDCAAVTSLMGIGSVAKSNPNNFGMVGMHGSYTANLAMYQADAVLAMGVRFDDRATGVISKFCPNAKILHIDIDAAEINKILPAKISLVGDVETILPQLTKIVREKKADAAVVAERQAWLKDLQKTFAENTSLELGRPKNSSSVNPRAFIADIPANAGKAGLKESDIIVTTDVGQHQMWSAQYYPVEHARQFLTSGSLGTMGFGLPVALGAAVANPDKRVVCVSGDGSILMNVQEMATLAEQNLDVTIVLFQNGSLGMVRQQQEYLFDKNYSASIFMKVPDFINVAKGFGIDAVCANDDQDWYKKAFTKGPHLVLVHIDMEENVLPFVKAGKANIDSIRD